MKVVATLLVVFLAIAVAEEAAPQYGISTGNAAAFTAPDELVESTADVEGGKSCFVVYPCLGGDITVTRSALVAGIGSMSLVQEVEDVHMGNDSDEDDEGPGGIDDAPDW